MEELELMEKEQKIEIIDAIKERRIYDFVCSDSYRIDNEILMDLLKECIAVIDREKDYEELIDNLKEFRDWEEK